MDSINKFIPDFDKTVAEARVEVGKPSKHHHTGPVFYAEINLNLGKKMYRATVEHEDLYAAIDKVRDAIEVQIRKDKTKKEASHRYRRSRKI
ncbi:MAG: hypothetical protein CEN90_293 [Parcubacteria group bacterium Licking1014_17]|nr:MAG: hypothetical protein CEN90_293 [Parcubacteria group bacterium Licking1014_17]